MCEKDKNDGGTIEGGYEIDDTDRDPKETDSIPAPDVELIE